VLKAKTTTTLLTAVALLFAWSSIGASGCNITLPWDPGTSPPLCSTMGQGGAGGDDGAGGGGGNDGVGGAPGSGSGAGAGPGNVNSAAVSAGAGPGDGAGAGAGPGMRTAGDHPRRVRRHDKENIGTTAQADCTELMAPMPPFLIGLSTTRLRYIAAQNGIGVGQSGIQQSRSIGLAFENWVLTTMGQLPRWTTPILSLRREKNTGGLPKSVIPESVQDLGWWWVLVSRPDFEKSSFFEVKAVTGALTLGTSNWQILGLIDVASQSPAGISTQPGVARPVVVFTTTSNTTISPSVGAEATALGVGVWQQRVMYDANTNPDNPDLYIDLPPEEINPDVYLPTVIDTSLTGRLSTWPHSPLTSPKTPATNLVVQGDPDPAEVD
jgi:hypothetical protein